jgi:hypothetical protein
MVCWSPTKVFDITGGAPAVQIVPDNTKSPFRGSYTIQVIGTNDVFISGLPGVTDGGGDPSTRGIRLFRTSDPSTVPDSTYTNSVGSGPIYAYASGNTSVVVMLEWPEQTFPSF